MARPIKFNQLPDQRFDERDTLFARMNRSAGTEPYNDYYQRRPELQDIDDRLRSMPALLDPEGLYYDQEIMTRTGQYFADIDKIEVDHEFVCDWSVKLTAARDKSTLIKKLTRQLGAVAVGFCELDQEFIYTQKGRFDHDYGRNIELDHPRMIVFLVEMDYQRMQRAPKADTFLESARQYYRAAVISRTVAAILEQSGYPAKAHYDAHYDLILPPLAIKAGLGELGRNNILIADKYGSRVRIGAVTTALPLCPDHPVTLGARHFCEICRKCVRRCPPKALALGEKETVRGVDKWPTKVEKCYTYWRRVGTDCGLCMAVCPFSHRNSWLHNLVRLFIRHFPILHRPARWLDDLIYGR
ncbi:MAG: 4Fe-4S dicluster domain-containing protein [Candidatus Neomarinimicrobiota bacterium]